jgi:hypothetical protein
MHHLPTQLGLALGLSHTVHMQGKGHNNAVNNGQVVMHVSNQVDTRHQAFEAILSLVKTGQSLDVYCDSAVIHHMCIWRSKKGRTGTFQLIAVLILVLVFFFNYFFLNYHYYVIPSMIDNGKYRNN